MGSTTLVIEYAVWHYGRAPREILEMGRDFLWFFYHFFSIPLILKTLFSPFYRIKEDYRGGLELEAMLESLVANTVSRVIGLILRTLVLLMGIVVLAATLLAVVVVFITWILLPAVWLAFLFFALT